MSPLPLEDFGQFEADKVTEAAPSGPSPDYQTGYEEGRRAALEEIAAASDLLTERFVSKFEDIEFALAEARQHILSALSPLIFDLSERLVPELCCAGFSTRLAAQITEHLEAASNSGVILSVAPDAEASVRSALPVRLSQNTQVIADPALTSDQVIIGSEYGEEMLDLSQFISELQTALEAVIQQERTLSHG